MKKNIRQFITIFSISSFLCAQSSLVFAEKIKLKSGMVLDGTVIGQTETHIRVKTEKTIFTVKLQDIVAKMADDLRRYPRTMEPVEANNVMRVEPYLQGFDEVDEYESLIFNIIFQESFAELDQISKTLRNEDRKFLNGESYLEHFYLGLIYGVENDVADYEGQIRSLKRWKQKHPFSLTQRIALAEIYLKLAWFYESIMNPDDTLKEIHTDKDKVFAGKKYGEYIQKAFDELKSVKDLKDRDVHFYSVLIKVGMGMGFNIDTLLSFLKKGRALDSSYRLLYLNFCTSILQEWSGNPGDVESFTKLIMSKFKGGEKDTIYMKIVADVFLYLGEEKFKNLYHFDWPLVQQGFDAYERIYPYNFYYLNVYAYMACVFEDKELAKQLFIKIGDNWNGYSLEVWGDVDVFIKYKGWAYGYY